MKLPDGIVIIALGSNLGDPASQVRHAMSELKKLSLETVYLSSLWETEPVDCPPGSPNFVNAVAALMPRLGETAFSLLKKTQALEREFGRRRKKTRNAARPLDLDLIAFGRHQIETPELILPHPRAAQRRFVLGPLAEIDPRFILPGQTLPVAALLSALEETAPSARRLE